MAARSEARADMSNTVSGVLDRARQILAGFTTGQKVITVLAVIGLLAGGYMFSTWASKPTYAPLFSNLPASDASAIVDKLNSGGTPYQLTDGGGTILVPQDKVYATRLSMSGQGLPANDASGYSLLDKEGITASDFRQHVAYQRALEGELAKTVQAIDGVRTAVVHLAMPEKDVFAEDQKSATASVLVDTQPGKKVSAQQVQAIVHLVSSSVQGLSPDQVTVADSTGRVLSVPGEAGAIDAAGDTRSQQQQAVQNQLEQSAQEMVNQVVGTGHSVVRVSADLDFDQRKTTSEKYAAPSPGPTTGTAVADTKTTETYTGAGSPTGGVLGTGPTTAQSSSGSSQYRKDSETRNNALDRVVEETKAAPGAVRRLTVAVLLDNKTAGAIDPTAIKTLVSNAVGLDAKRGDVIEVGQLTFDTSAAAEAKKQLAEARKAEDRKSLMSSVRSGGLLGVVGLVLLFTLLSGRRRRKSRASADQAGANLTELADLRQVVALQVAADQQRQLEGGAGAVAVLERGDRGPDNAAQLALVHGEIAEMVERQPDEVAQLLRSWLADRRS
jgi:flagellar M-ring protein FliF